MIRVFVGAVMFVLLALPQGPVPRQAGTITIDASRQGHAIPRNLYGIFSKKSRTPEREAFTPS